VVGDCFAQQSVDISAVSQSDWIYHVQVHGNKVERVDRSSALDLFQAAEETDGHSRGSWHSGGVDATGLKPTRGDESR
jgi:hypothetical protein